MKLTTDQIIARHGLLVQAGAAPQNGWIVGADGMPCCYFKTYDRNWAVALYCDRHELKTEDTATEDLARKYGIAISVDMTGIWTATTPSGFHSFRADTAKDAVEMAAAQAERDFEYKAQKEAAKAKAEANAFGFEKGGYVSGDYVPLTAQIKCTVAQAQAPAKKPAQAIADAKDSAQANIAHAVAKELGRIKDDTGCLVEEVRVAIKQLPGKAGAYVQSVTVTTTG